MERPHVKEEILSIELEITWKESVGHLFSQYASLALLSSPIQLTHLPRFLHFLAITLKALHLIGGFPL
jgi:hypothetical protein